MTKLITIIFWLLFSDALIARTNQSGKIVGQGTTPIKITLDEPQAGWTLDRMIKVSGRISDSTLSPVTVSINGDKYFLETNSGRFSRSFPVTKGKNSITVIGANKSGTYQKEKTIYAEIEPLPMMVVLTSDTDGVYTDLHIYEPTDDSESPDEHVYWADTSSKSGGKFYLNEQNGSYDKPGYGPYLYTHRSPPIGYYRIDANYWPSGDKAHTVANLNIVLFGGTTNELRRVVKYPLVKPGETKTLAWIKIEKNNVGHIYSPVTDINPNPDIWNNIISK